MQRKSKKAQNNRVRRSDRRRVRKMRRKKSNRTTAAIVLAKPTTITAPAMEVTVIPQIERTIENLERVRRFVSKALNRDLQRALTKLAAKKDLKPEDRKKEEADIRERLEIDWGTIPFVDKPFLKQPGAEKFLLWLNLYPKYTKQTIESPGGHLEMVCSVNVHAKKTHELVFEGPDCSCTTMESNYRFRWAECDPPTDDEVDRLVKVRMGMWRKKNFYAHGKFVKRDWQWYQRVENPNIYDERNKVRQIGEKRALVKCIRNMGAISEIFTADPSEWEQEPEPGEGNPKDDEDFTPGGRKIYNEEGVSPSGRYQDTRRPAKEARGPVDLSGRTDGKIYPPTDQSNSGAISREPVERKNGKITVTWIAGLPLVSGDLARIFPAIQEKVLCQWLDSKKAYAVPAPDLHILHDIVIARGYEYEEVSAAPAATATAAPPADPGPGSAAKAAAEKPAGAGARLDPPHTAPSAGDEVTGTIDLAQPGKTPKTGARYLDVKIHGFFYHCYNTDLHPYLNAGVGKLATVFLDKRKQIVGIKKIAGREFTEGKFPVIDVNEDRPKDTPSLFK